MTPTPTNTDDVTVRLEDREAAREWIEDICGKHLANDRERTLLAQAFARHRAHQSAEVERLREILKFVSDDGGFPRFSVRLGHGFDSAVMAALALTGVEK